MFNKIKTIFSSLFSLVMELVLSVYTLAKDLVSSSKDFVMNVYTALSMFVKTIIG